jgi:hypothetical protein
LLRKRQINKYNKLLKRLQKTKSLGQMSKLINRYVDGGNHVPAIRSTTDYGDCNGNGIIDILDILILIGFIIGNENVNQYIDTILSNCNIRLAPNGELIPSGYQIPSIVDVVSLVNYILLDEDEDDEDTHELDLVIDNQELMERVYGYQWGQFGYNYMDSFDYTNGLEVNIDYPLLEFSLSDYQPELTNRVLITAPHSQRVYRSSVWEVDGWPGSGLDYCNSCNNPPLCNDASDFPSCHKGSDTCTGAMAKVLSEITGASYLAARRKQEDPNYYDIIGIDFDGYDSRNNNDSGNVADPDANYYDYNGIQTAFPFQIENTHPFKVKLTDYLNSHPEIKLVIDLHGSSATTNHWDIDFGLLGNNGPDGTLNINEADIGNEKIDLGDCEKYSGNCPDGITGHGPISYNDFAAANQDTVTKYVNQNHSGVHAVQIETAAIYRCGGTSDSDDVVRYMRALQRIVHNVNIYYHNYGN